MLTEEENKLLTQVSRGTPMGEMLRRYWTPACLSKELPEPDCDPIRVRLFGEDLVAFRDTQGRVGLMEDQCPHRGASLSFGRNEGGGLRCLYHGWKMDVQGNVLDTPCEPHDSDFRHRVKHRAYPTREAGDVVWAYLGPRDKEPTFPQFQWTLVPESQRVVRKVLWECSWLQAIEGSVDIPHNMALHGGQDIMRYPDDQRHLRQGPPHQEVEDTAYGFCHVYTWPDVEAPNEYKLLRIKPFVLPFHSYIQGINEGGHTGLHLFVPMDDYNNWYYEIRYNLSKSVDPREPERYLEVGVDLDESGRKIKRRLSNAYLQDRAEMRAMRSFSGIAGRPHEDMAMTESMNPICDRTKEHLGSSDLAVIRLRRRLQDSLQMFLDGEDPIGLDSSIPYDRIGVIRTVVPLDTAWQEIAAKSRGELATV